MDFAPVRVSRRKLEEDEDTADDPCRSRKWEVMTNMHHKCAHLFIDLSLRKAKVQAAQHKLVEALGVLCIAKQVVLRVVHPLPRAVADLNFQIGRIHSQLMWEKQCMSVARWGMSTPPQEAPAEAEDAAPELPAEPSSQAFDFADSCLRESFRIVAELSNHDHVMLRRCLLELVRLHGLQPGGAHVPLLLQRATEVAQMEHKLYSDTLSLFDAAEISGESIDPGISAGVIDSLRFFNMSRATPMQIEDGDESTLQVSAPALLMYHLTLVKERPSAGCMLGALFESGSTMLHRSLKNMFARYLESCCTDAESTLPSAEPVGPAAGVVSVSWCEYPLNADYTSNDDVGSRPSSAASIAVLAARESESEVRTKRISSTMIYSLAALEDGSDAGPIGMVEMDVHKVQQLHRNLCSVRFDIDKHKADGTEMPSELIGAAHECVSSAQQMLQRQQPEDDSSADVPEDPTSWIPILEAIFERQSGFSASVDPEIHRWMAQALSRH